MAPPGERGDVAGQRPDYRRAPGSGLARRYSVSGGSLELRNAPGTAWRTKPSWYIVSANDRTVNPELQRSAAKRMGAATYEVESSHVAMLSHPAFVLSVIRAAAAAVQEPAVG